MELKNGIWRRPRGIIRLEVFKDGRLIRKEVLKNLFVNAGKPALANLLGGATGSWDVTAIGFGSGSVAPTVGDTTLTAPAYYKAIGAPSYDGLGSVTFAWTLTTGDTGAIGITIQELGMYANNTTVSLPGATEPATLIARRTIAPIVFTSGMNISGTWEETF
jgi:hypothetical protein